MKIPTANILTSQWAHQNPTANTVRKMAMTTATSGGGWVSTASNTHRCHHLLKPLIMKRLLNHTLPITCIPYADHATGGLKKNKISLFIWILKEKNNPVTLIWYSNNQGKIVYWSYLMTCMTQTLRKTTCICYLRQLLRHICATSSNSVQVTGPSWEPTMTSYHLCTVLENFNEWRGGVSSFDLPYIGS